MNASGSGDGSPPQDTFTAEELEFMNDLASLGSPSSPDAPPSSPLSIDDSNVVGVDPQQPLPSQDTLSPIPPSSNTGLFGLRRMPTLPPPRTFDALDREVKTAIDSRELYSGFKFFFTRLLHPGFQMTHSLGWASGSPREDGYQLMTAYGNKRYSLNARYHPGDATVMGTANVNWGRTRWGFHGNSSRGGTHPSQYTFDVSYRGNGFIAGAKYHNVSVVETTFVQAITKGVSAGVHGLFGIESGTSVTGALRWQGPLGTNALNEDSKTLCIVNANATTGATGHELSLAYSQLKNRFSKVWQSRRVWGTQLSMRKEWMRGSWSDWEPRLSVGYSYDVGVAQVKANVGTDWKAYASWEERVDESFSLSINTEMDYWHDKYTFGCSISVNM